MNVSDAKAIVQQLLHSKPWNKDDVLQRYPDLVDKSRNTLVPRITLYRILKVNQDDNNAINPHYVASTSRKFSSLVDIADKMPSMLWGEKGMISLNSVYMKFEVSADRILLDIDRVVLPMIKDKLKNTMHHTIENKWGDRISIKSALEDYEQSDEAEIVADLEELEYTSLSCPNHALGSTRQHNIKHLLKNEVNQLSTGFNSPTEDLLNFKTVLSHEDYLIGLKCLKNNNILNTKEISSPSIMPRGEPAF